MSMNGYFARGTEVFGTTSIAFGSYSSIVGAGGGCWESKISANGRAASFFMLNVSITAVRGPRSMRQCPSCKLYDRFIPHPFVEWIAGAARVQDSARDSLCF